MISGKLFRQDHADALHQLLPGYSASAIGHAAAAGIDAVGVAWGFRFAKELYEAGAERVVTTVAELEAELFKEA